MAGNGSEQESGEAKTNLRGERTGRGGCGPDRDSGMAAQAGGGERALGWSGEDEIARRAHGEKPTKGRKGCKGRKP